VLLYDVCWHFRKSMWRFKRCVMLHAGYNVAIVEHLLTIAD
jgi:hypothetical protein